MLNKIVLSLIPASFSELFGDYGLERLYAPASFCALGFGVLFIPERIGFGKICLAENKDMSLARHSLAGIWLGGYAGYNDSIYKPGRLQLPGNAPKALHA